jgi:transposase-like protein
MVDAGLAVGRKRKRRSVTEKRRISKLMFAPGAGVSLLARAYGVNSESGAQAVPRVEAY